jgi:hypothetical protein
MSSCQRTLQPYFDSTVRYKNLIAIPGTSKANNIQSNGGNQVLEGKDVDLGFFGQGDERQRGCEGSEGSHRQEKKQETIHANADLDFHLHPEHLKRQCWRCRKLSERCSSLATCGSLCRRTTPDVVYFLLFKMMTGKQAKCKRRIRSKSCKIK